MSLDDDFYNLDPSEWANLILPNIVNVTTDCQDSLTKYRHRNEYNECGDPNVIVDQLLPKNCSHPRQCLQDPKTRLQTQKLIQNTVRVPASEYLMNLAALTAYETPSHTYNVVDVAGTNYVVSPGVNWNQMSDRAQPHIQTVKKGSYGSNSVKHTITRLRPGALSPGGHGVDIKHNSYDRYLNRLKGKSALRRGSDIRAIAPDVVFNPAFPVYGDKTYKTAIVAGCHCLPKIR